MASVWSGEKGTGVLVVASSDRTINPASISRAEREGNLNHHEAAEQAPLRAAA